MIKGNLTVVKFQTPNYMGSKQLHSIRKTIKHSWILQHTLFSNQQMKQSRNK